MKLAGEAGSLLKIEEEIAGAVAEAKQKWLADTQPEQGRLFADDIAPAAQKERGLDVTGITDETFWEKAEERIYAALQAYAEQAEHGGGYQRRLFADDAARGFAFIDLCRKRYDVALMNPPFGETSPATQSLLDNDYHPAARNLLCAFILRMTQLCHDLGSFGSITDRTLIQKTTYDLFRDQILTGPWRLQTLVDLGWGVLDGAQVATCMQIMRSEKTSNGELDSLDVRNYEDAERKVLILEFALEFTGSVTPLHTFALFPDKAIAHWCPDTLKSLFETGNVNPSQFCILEKRYFRWGYYSSIPPRMGSSNKPKVKRKSVGIPSKRWRIFSILQRYVFSRLE